jgi:predicted methyltransferase
MTSNELVPPASMIFDGSRSQDDFVAVGDRFTKYFLIGHAGLKPDERVLDLGSGIGQKARVLAAYLSERGSY